MKNGKANAYSTNKPVGALHSQSTPGFYSNNLMLVLSFIQSRDNMRLIIPPYMKSELNYIFPIITRLVLYEINFGGYRE